ncbi:hypothetical protein E2C01_054290 [Portunus trituberculatus]|uniref:Uncharacterized protein n=1 Tax=Portunus trituberculatus TaxID=210409 RepID=A0A5B7GJI1_PORTR|nr:hypothetical protein [Portunus trituberculatus]
MLHHEGGKLPPSLLKDHCREEGGDVLPAMLAIVFPGDRGVWRTTTGVGAASPPSERLARGKQEWSMLVGGRVGDRKRGAPGEASPPVLRRQGVQNRSAAAPTQPDQACQRHHPPPLSPHLTPPTLLLWLSPSRSHTSSPSSPSAPFHGFPFPLILLTSLLSSSSSSSFLSIHIP